MNIPLDNDKDASDYISKRRNILPKVYNCNRSDGRTNEQLHLLTTAEFSDAIETNSGALTSRFEVKKENFCCEISELRGRIMRYNLAGTEELDDSDIEDIQDDIDDVDSDLELEILCPRPIKFEDNEYPNEHSLRNGSEILNDAITAVPVEREVDSCQPVEHQYEKPDSNDVFSGDIEFEENIVGDRYYNKVNVTIKSNILELLKAWNSTRPFSTIFYDRQFVNVLLKEVFGANLTMGGLDENLLSFVKSVFSIRVNDDDARLFEFEGYVDKKCAKAKEKQQNQPSKVQF